MKEKSENRRGYPCEKFRRLVFEDSEPFRFNDNLFHFVADFVILCKYRCCDGWFDRILSHDSGRKVRQLTQKP